jgi:hypothetical protein
VKNARSVIKIDSHTWAEDVELQVRIFVKNLTSSGKVGTVFLVPGEGWILVKDGQKEI